MVYLVFGNYAILFFIPMVIFIITMIVSIFKPITINVTQDKPWKEVLFCDGHIGNILMLDIGGGGIFAFILTLIEEFANCGLRFLGIFLLFFVIQVFHYMNFITTNKNKIILSCFCLIFSIPIVYLLTLGLISSVPLAINF